MLLTLGALCSLQVYWKPLSALLHAALRGFSGRFTCRHQGGQHGAPETVHCAVARCALATARGRQGAARHHRRLARGDHPPTGGEERLRCAGADTRTEHVLHPRTQQPRQRCVLLNIFSPRAQIEEMLRATLSKLERQQSALTSGLSVSEPAPEVYADTRSAYGLSMHQSVSHSGAHQAQVAHPYATAQSMQRQHMHPAAPHEMEYRAMYPGAQGEMMQGASNSGSIPMIAIPSRKPTPKSMRPASIAEQQHSLQSMQSMHLQHAPPAMAATWQGVHPQHMQQMPRHPSPAQAAALPAHMMPQYLPPGMPMHGHGMYGYAPQHPQMHMPHDPAMAGMPAQYFMPVDASFKDSSSRPQVRCVVCAFACHLISFATSDAAGAPRAGGCLRAWRTRLYVWGLCCTGKARCKTNARCVHRRGMARC